ncbi:unnamed protein product [Chrysoparadoxa australica]
MNTELFNRMLWSVQASQLPTTTPSDRKSAFEFLEAFKAREDCSEYALYVLTKVKPEHTDPVRHFALHCLENLMKDRWNRLDASQHARYRQAMLELIKFGTKDILAEALFVKEKVAVLTAEVAKREFPQHWEGFVEELRQVWGLGHKQAELAIMALTAVIEDTMNSDFSTCLPSQRRNDILTGLNLALPGLLPFMYDYMNQQYAWYRECTEASMTTGTILLNRALGLMRSLLPWAPPDLLYSATQGGDFLEVFVALLAEPRLRFEALKCLSEVVSLKSVSHELFMRLLRTLPPVATGLAAAVSQTQSNSGLPLHDSLELFHLLSTCCADLLSKNMAHVLDDKVFAAPGSEQYNLLGSYLELVVRIAEMPSVIMATNSVSVLLEVAKAKSLSSLPCFQALTKRIMEAYSSKLVKIRWSDDDTTEDFVAAEEFSDASEYHSHLNTLKGYVVLLGKRIGHSQPQEMFTFLVERLHRLMVTYSGPPEDHLSEKGQPTRHTEACMQFEALALVMEHGLAALPEWFLGGDIGSEPEAMARRERQRQQSVESLTGAVQALLAWKPTGALLCNARLAMVEACRRFLRYNPPLLSTALQQFFEAAEYFDPWLAPQASSMPALSKEAVALRRRAGVCCVQTATQLPDVLVGALGELCVAVQEVTARGLVIDGQRQNLYEMLVIISNAVQDISKRRAFVMDVIAQSLGTISSPEVTAGFSSAQSLLHALGVDDPAGPNNTANVHRSRAFFEQVKVSLATLLAVGKRVKPVVPLAEMSPEQFSALTMKDLASNHPFVSAWPTILPNLVAMIKCIHLIWEPTVRNSLLQHPQARYALGMPPEEVLSKAKVGAALTAPSTEAERQQKVLNENNLIFCWGSWLGELRQHAYSLMGLACFQHALYLLTDASSIQQVLQSSLLAALDYVEHRHIPPLIRSVVLPYLSHCPPALFRSHFTPLAAPFFIHMLHRLSMTWKPPLPSEVADQDLLKIYVEGGALLCADPIPGETREVLEDKIKRETTRAHIDLVQVLLGLKGELAVMEDGGGKKLSAADAMGAGVPAKERLRADASARQKFMVLEMDEVSYPLLMVTVGAFCWPDAYTCRRAIKIATTIVDFVWKVPKFSSAIGSDLFGAAVLGLVTEPKWMVGLEYEVLALVREIYLRLVIGMDPSINSSPKGGPPAPTPVTDLPRQVLLSLPGVHPENVAALEVVLQKTGQGSAKSHKDALADLLRTAAEYADLTSQAGGEGKARVEESLLQKKKSLAIMDLPTKLSARSTKLKQRNEADEVSDLSSLFDL